LLLIALDAGQSGARHQGLPAPADANPLLRNIGQILRITANRTSRKTERCLFVDKFVDF
jgi:hypothetical protein